MYGVTVTREGLECHNAVEFEYYNNPKLAVSWFRADLCAYCAGSSGANGFVDDELTIDWKSVLHVCRQCRAKGALPLARIKRRNGANMLDVLPVLAWWPLLLKPQRMMVFLWWKDRTSLHQCRILYRGLPSVDARRVHHLRRVQRAPAGGTLAFVANATPGTYMNTTSSIWHRCVTTML